MAVQCNVVCPSVQNDNMRGEMKRRLSVCLSYVHSSVRGEMKLVSLFYY